MGREARRNKSAEQAAALGYRRPERVTVGSIRRQRRAEMREHLASLLAGAAMHRLAQQAEREQEAELVARHNAATLIARIGRGVGIREIPSTGGQA